ncbi:DUF262 domain-containing protein [Mycolicibacterium baixiangningiae]|uniref:DUF262 domain-containing protein n=1 Tax=Mycolicibacterium baixiangningiae TaxID=2761578 RepID=UPI001867AA24|nr:DUF262 domain-containing protein [Mycolicibacterium baixiangningiae]
MKKIDGVARSVAQILKGSKYVIDYYQRDYKWEEKQLQELLDDLSGKFLEAYDPSHRRDAVATYPFYFLGSIVISEKDTQRFIVDGQQRLTTLTLLLTYLRELQGANREPNIDELIISDTFGKRSFNLDVDDRIACMTALYDGLPFTASPADSDSVRNLVERYDDIGELLPKQLQGEALPYFIDWLQHCVQIIQITAYSDDDAYTIFETMNDRGLQLRPVDMLKGYLLAGIDEDTRRVPADLWRHRVQDLAALGKELDADFFKAWLRSQYAETIRERRKGAVGLDYDKIGTEFHRWLRSNAPRIGLQQSADFARFIGNDFEFYSRHFATIMSATKAPVLVAGLERVRYNADHQFTLQLPMLLAPLVVGEDDAVAVRKIGLVAQFVDILLSWRIWNNRAIDASTLQYRTFIVTKAIRGKDLPALGQSLYEQLMQEVERIGSTDRLRLHQQNRRPIHRLLARLTDYIEVESGGHSTYVQMTTGTPVKYEVEHIWANHPRRHSDEFEHAADFADHRNLIGDLLLLPKKFNASYGDMTFEKKLPHYNAQNLLARSLNQQCYQNNPGFLQFIARTGLPFRPYDDFTAQAVLDRGTLYQQVAQHLWNPDDLLITDDTVSSP